jgi:cation-transporting ATPase E
MASGSSAARNVAHIVSLDNDFSKLPDVVAEGRRVINNLQRTATLFLTKTVFAVLDDHDLLGCQLGHQQGFCLSFNDE